MLNPKQFMCVFFVSDAKERSKSDSSIVVFLSWVLLGCSFYDSMSKLAVYAGELQQLSVLLWWFPQARDENGSYFRASSAAIQWRRSVSAVKRKWTSLLRAVYKDALGPCDSLHTALWKTLTEQPGFISYMSKVRLRSLKRRWYFSSLLCVFLWDLKAYEGSDKCPIIYSVCNCDPVPLH